jgi:hypothetical protein
MAQVSRDNSKLKFQTGDVPTQADFEDLHDSVPFFIASYTGESGKVLKVKTDETGLEFGTAASEVPAALKLFTYYNFI